MKYPRLTIAIVVIALSAAACGGAANTTPSAVPTAAHSAVPTAAAATATPHATPAATTTPAPSRTPRPTRTPAPTIGEPADDGARIIAVDTPSINGAVATRARDLTIDSPAVGVVQVRLLLPKHFESQTSTRWPVLYLLGGSSGDHTGWTYELIDVTPLFAPTDLLVVMPDCGSSDPGGCSYTDWWNRGNGGPRQWETFHLVELRQLLERNWQASDRRAIAGVSAGGYGAIEYAARQPGMFLFAGSFSGPLDQRAAMLHWGRPAVDMWGDPVAQADIWDAHDPLINAQALRGTALYVAYGNGKPGPLDYLNGVIWWDPDGSTERECGVESAAFVQRLAELDIPVTVYAYGNGTHSNPYILRDLHRSLPLILDALGL